MQSIPDLIRTIGERLVGDGVPVSRIFVIVPTLHPEYIGQAFRWLRDDPEVFQGFGQHGVQHTSRQRCQQGFEVVGRWIEPIGR